MYITALVVNCKLNAFIYLIVVLKLVLRLNLKLLNECYL